MTLALRYAARSDVGLLRDGNEDSLYAGPRLLAIADGMGGHVAGEVASSVVIATLAHLDEDAPGSDLLGALERATRAANDYLRDMVKSDRHLEGMGTTLTAMLVDGGRGGLIHIGDSRGYLFRRGELTQITHDHSLVQTLVDEGRITADEALHHPQRSLILRALDGRDDIEPDLSVRELQEGDRYLLCSDGLTDVVTESTIRETLGKATTAEDAVERLVDLALRGGGPDNVTVIVADVIDNAGSDEVVVAGAAAASDVRHGPTPDTPAGRAALAARATAASQAGETADTGSAHSGGHGGAHGSGHGSGHARRPRRTARIVAAATALVLLIGGALLGGWLYVRAQYFVGPAGDSGAEQVAILRGVSGSFLGLPLHSVHSRSNIPLDQLPQYERERVDEGINAASLADARRIVDRLRTETICATAPTGPSPATSPSASVSPAPSPTGSKRAHPTLSPTPTVGPTAPTTPAAGGSPCTGGRP